MASVVFRFNLAFRPYKLELENADEIVYVWQRHSTHPPFGTVLFNSCQKFIGTNHSYPCTRYMHSRHLMLQGPVIVKLQYI